MSLNTAVVPDVVKTAAARAFIRTLTQGYAGAIPAGGVTAAALMNFVHPANATLTAVSIVAWALAPLLGASVSWLSILSNGVPADYTNVVTSVPPAAAAVTTQTPPVTFAPSGGSQPSAPWAGTSA